MNNGPTDKDFAGPLASRGTHSEEILVVAGARTKVAGARTKLMLPDGTQVSLNCKRRLNYSDVFNVKPNEKLALNKSVTPSNHFPRPTSQPAASGTFDKFRFSGISEKETPDNALMDWQLARGFIIKKQQQ